MRISESRIRQIIREEAKKALQEMPYAGSLGIKPSSRPNWESFTSGISAGGVNRPGAEKYARSGRFKTLAKKHFDNIPYGVWTAAIIGDGSDAGVDDDPEMSKRGAVLDLNAEGRQLLERLGFQTPAQIGKNDLVILYSAMTVDSDFLATPWMVLHSIFDSNSMSEELVPGYRELYSHITYGADTDDFDESYWYGDGEEGEDEADEADEDDDDMSEQRVIGDSDDGEDGDPLAPLSNLTDNVEEFDAVLSALTMNSARSGQIGSGSDILPEMMCQELITRGGLKINFGPVSDKPRIERALRELASQVKKMAADFRRNAQGKLIVTATN
jgi:hypothetical protein